MRAFELEHVAGQDLVTAGPHLERGERVAVIEMAAVAQMVDRIKSSLDSLAYAAPELWPAHFGHIKQALAEFEERSA